MDPTTSAGSFSSSLRVESHALPSATSTLNQAHAAPKRLMIEVAPTHRVAVFVLHASGVRSERVDEVGWATARALGRAGGVGRATVRSRV